jgi:2-methylcitrate dehydratase PrpD
MRNAVNATELIANFIVNTTYEDLPEKAIQIAKMSLIDSIGTCLAGSTTDAGQIITDYLREEKSRPEATVIAKGFKASAGDAALANGTMMHALDYDDTSENFFGHPTTVILPAVMAAGEWKKISGKEALLAYILGYEIGNKIGYGMGPTPFDTGWHATGTFGALASVAASAKVLKLNIHQTRMAMGMAASMAAGIRQNVGTMTKPLHAGNAARSGIFATILASKGFTADQAILEAPIGYAHVFGGNSTPDLGRMTNNLGSPFEIISGPPIIKLYPSCRATAGPLDAILNIVQEHNFEADDVFEVECLTSSHTPKVLIHNQPKTAMEGKFSIQYCMAVAILDKSAGLNQFIDDRLKDPRMQELMAKVRYTHPPEWGSSPVDSMRGKVEIVVKLKNGKEFSSLVKSSKGDTENPLKLSDIETKFLDCAKLVFSPAKARVCLEKISTLDKTEDISSLMKLLGRTTI